MGRPSSQITWARELATGALIRADRAQRRPGRGRYRCLDARCCRDLTVAKSKFGRQHFRHFRGDHADDCVFHSQGKSQYQHRAAQTLLAVLFSEAIQRHLPMPLMRFNTPVGVREVLPFITASRVELEWNCPLTGRRIDVALIGPDDLPVLLVEVRNTHAVSQTKQDDLRSYWWIEVEALAVISDPRTMNVIAHGNLPTALLLAWQQFALFE